MTSGPIRKLVFLSAATAFTIFLCGFSSAGKEKTLQKIDMLTTARGFCITGSHDLARTDDAGKTWKGLLKLPSGASDLCALSSQTIYAVSGTGSGIRVYKTVNGGRNWSSSLLRRGASHTAAGGAPAISMTDGSAGFLLTSGLPAGGLMGKALYREKADRWSLKKELQGSSYLQGYTTGLSFCSALTGYLTCSYRGDVRIPLYRTTDGGRGWKPQSLPLPKKYSRLKNYYADIYPPSFYGKSRRSAKMILCFHHNDSADSYVYSTGNGGAGWRLRGLSKKAMTVYSFVSGSDGFALNKAGKLYVTSDGGITWAQRA